MEGVLVDYATRYFQATVIDTSDLESQKRLVMVFRHLPELQKDQRSPASSA
jgi:hypothetical protein